MYLWGKCGIDHAKTAEPIVCGDKWGGQRNSDSNKWECTLEPTVKRLFAAAMSGSVESGGDAACSQIILDNPFTRPILTTVKRTESQYSYIYGPSTRVPATVLHR